MFICGVDYSYLYILVPYAFYRRFHGLLRVCFGGALRGGRFDVLAGIYRRLEPVEHHCPGLRHTGNHRRHDYEAGGGYREAALKARPLTGIDGFSVYAVLVCYVGFYGAVINIFLFHACHSFASFCRTDARRRCMRLFTADSLRFSSRAMSATVMSR